MNSTVLLTHFKNNLVKFVDELVEQFPEEEDLIMAHVLVKSDQMPISNIFKNFKGFLLPRTEVIKNRDEVFFLDENDIFSALNSTRKGTIKRMWTSSTIDDEDREIIWQWIETLLHICSKASN